MNRLSAITVATLALLIAGSSATAQPAPAVASPPVVTASQRAEFERGLMLSPGGPMLRAIKADFPRDYEAMVGEMIRGASTSGGDRAALERVGFNAVRGFYALRLREIVNAPAANLNAFNRSELALIRALAAHDVALCNIYVTTGFTPGTAVPESFKDEMLAVGLAMIAAAKAGTGRQVDSQRGFLDAETAAAWTAKMRELDPSEAMTRLLTLGQEGITGAEEGCQVGTKLYEAIGALPAEQSATITAYLIKASLSAQR